MRIFAAGAATLPVVAGACPETVLIASATTAIEGPRVFRTNP